MIDFKEYTLNIKDMYNISSENFLKDLSSFLVDNKWFGIEPVWNDGSMYIEPADFQEYLPLIKEYFANNNMDTNKKYEVLYDKLSLSMRDTSDKLQSFFEQFNFPATIRYELTSFIFKYIHLDVCMLTDSKINEIIEILCDEEQKCVGDAFTMFLAWCREHYKTRYVEDYILSQRFTRTDDNGAYDMEEYLHLLYYLYNPDYIENNDMYIRAAESKNYTDTWLYLALHYVCSIRDTDITRLYHPKLKYEASEILEMIKNGTFPEEDARMTLYSVTWRLTYLPLIPNKIKKHSGIPNVKFDVPESCEVHIGTLFALSEAHRLLEGVPDDEPLIRRVKSYSEISRYMGDEIGILFFESDFKARSMNKSYMQSVFVLTDNVMEENDEFNTKGYMMAALARSHKGSYGEFAKTTYTYLKDAKLSGLSPEFVARELFERGVLSFIPSMLLKMITDGEYNKLSVHNQTRLIKELDMTPSEIETIVRKATASFKKSAEIVNKLYTSSDRNSIIKALHRIGNGEAVSKQNECECLYTAFHKVCPYDENHNCIGCDYEISTKSTMFLMVSEYNRLMDLYKNSESLNEKEKNEYMLKSIVLPAMDEMITCVSENYGEHALSVLEKILEENING
jgi:hypothetical protein